jgi:hypothetical protein
LTTEVLQLNVRHVLKNEVYRGRFVRIVRVDTKDRFAFASQGQADDLCIVEVGPTSKPLLHCFRASQFFFDARFVHAGIIVQE